MTRAVFIAGAAATLLDGVSGVLVRSPASGGEDGPCACRSWKRTYAEAGVQCGQANEFFFATGRSTLEKYLLKEHTGRLGPEFCTHFYEKIDDNYCINVNMGADRGQWCYVDAACPTSDTAPR